jgi:hypothetical protein
VRPAIIRPGGGVVPWRCIDPDLSVALIKMWRTLISGLVLLLIARPGAAHHSGAMFDTQKSMTLRGTVRLFQWTNPHCWIQLLVPSPAGTAEWSIEMGSNGQLYRNGWRSSTLNAGQKIEVVIHPVRDGTAAGQFVSATAADGSFLGRSTAPASP